MVPFVQPSHVAVLVPSVRKAAAALRDFGFAIGPEEDFEGEGTREIYVEFGKANSLLLMEPMGPGVYQKALEKRGPGLHHLAIDVANLQEFLATISGSGWLLHPRSVETMARVKTVYLARPGFPSLIEVQEKANVTASGELFVRRVWLPIPEVLGKLPDRIGLGEIVLAGAGALELGPHKISLEILYAS